MYSTKAIYKTLKRVMAMATVAKSTAKTSDIRERWRWVQLKQEDRCLTITASDGLAWVEQRVQGTWDHKTDPDDFIMAVDPRDLLEVVESQLERSSELVILGRKRGIVVMTPWLTASISRKTSAIIDDMPSVHTDLAASVSLKPESKPLPADLIAPALLCVKESNHVRWDGVSITITDGLLVVSSTDGRRMFVGSVPTLKVEQPCTFFLRANLMSRLTPFIAEREAIDIGLYRPEEKRWWVSFTTDAGRLLMPCEEVEVTPYQMMTAGMPGLDGLKGVKASRKDAIAAFKPSARSIRGDEKMAVMLRNATQQPENCEEHIAIVLSARGSAGQSFSAMPGEGELSSEMEVNPRFMLEALGKMKSCQVSIETYDTALVVTGERERFVVAAYQR